MTDKQGWQPIETAPRDKTEVLVSGPLKDGTGHYQEVCRWWHDRWPVEWMDNCKAPTHWQPLPEPPHD